MNATDVVRELRAALENERNAIRRLDAAAVEEASQTKEKIISAIQATPAGEREPLIEAIGSLHGELRRNLVLLAHARDALRCALETARTTRLSTEL